MNAPTLPHGCNSWVIVNLTTGTPVFETSRRSVVEKINAERYEVLTAYAWLVRFNAIARGART